MSDMAGDATEFAPTFGQAPPHLAGRREEQSKLRNAVGKLVEGKPRKHFVMYGPRGVGKTCMLMWLESQCKEAGVEPLYATPATDLTSASDIPRLLLPPAWYEKWWLPKETEVGGISWASCPPR